MIENIHSVYNQPSIYNQGGGAPGDFGKGGGVVPTGYRQVAGVYVKDGWGNYAYKQYSLSSHFGITKTDFSGIKFDGKFYAPQTPVYSQNIHLFDLRNYGNPAKPIYIVVLFIPGNAAIQASNGSGTNGQLSSGKNITGVFEASISGANAVIDGFNYTNFTYSPPVTQPTPYIVPFVCVRTGYSTYSNNVATLYLKLYNADNELMLHFVPVVRESDGVPGLYDLVHDVFCDNPYCNVIEKIEE